MYPKKNIVMTDIKNCLSTIYNSQDMEATWMSINRWMDKEDVVDTYNEILLNHKNERNWVICSDVDEVRDCHTEWSKSERERQVSYINTKNGI